MVKVTLKNSQFWSSQCAGGITFCQMCLPVRRYLMPAQRPITRLFSYLPEAVSQ